MEKQKFNANFDEYQISVRHKIAFQSLLLTHVLALVNGIAATQHPWAPPMVQATFIIAIPALYFVTLAVFKNAYLGNRTRRPALTGLFALTLGLLNGAAVWFGPERRPLENGALTGDILPLLLGIFWGYIGIIILIKYFLENKSQAEE